MAVSFGDSSHLRSSSATHSYVTESAVEVQRHLSDIGSKGNSPFKMRKAKRIRFLCNGDRFYKGVVMAVAPERYRSFDSLLTDLTRAFSANNNLPSGVRTVYTMEGIKVSDLDELEDGKLYVCSGNGEQFKKVDYVVSCINGANNNRVKPARSLTKLPTSNYNSQGSYNSNSSNQTSNYNYQGSYNSNSSNQSKSVPRPRIIILIRNGLRPRRVLRLLLNKRNAPSFEHALSTITDAVKLDTGAVRKIYNSKGTQLTQLEEFFQEDDIVFVYGSERINADDFELDFEELKAIQALKKGLRRPVTELKNGTHCFDETGKKVPKLPNTTRQNMKTNGLKKSETMHAIPNKVLSRYSIGQVIGEGNFAVVRRCSDKLKNVDYALKIIDKSKVAGKEHMFDNEVSILRSVDHTNIIRLISEHDTPTELYLVMELVTGGDLFDAITKRQKFTEPDAQIMTHDLASALAYLHDNSILHRDIKPENLLVEMKGDHVKLLKVGDFGLAQRVTGPLYTVCGTPTYVAPEILTEVGYGLKIDVWAAGVILYILLCGFPPFVSSTNDQEELFDDILNGQYNFPAPYWNDVSNCAKDLITHMLQPNPDLRFSAEDVLDHAWLENSI